MNVIGLISLCACGLQQFVAGVETVRKENRMKAVSAHDASTSMYEVDAAGAINMRMSEKSSNDTAAPTADPTAGMLNGMVVDEIDTTVFDRIRKMGLVPGPSLVPVSAMEWFTPGSPHLHKNDGAKWFYTYNIVPTDEQIEFSNKNKVEFVPMAASRTHNMMRHKPSDWGPACEGDWCPGYTVADEDLTPASAPGMKLAWQEPSRLTVDQFIDVMKSGISGLDIKPRFLMGFNEPEDYHYAHKNFTGEEAAYIWGKYMQPAAEALNLSLVTPTVNAPGFRSGPPHNWVNGQWLSTFLRACWKMRTGSPACDINKISRIAVHFYTCMEPRWEEEFSHPDGAFYKNTAHLLSDIDDVDWADYLSKRPLWITEFNCNNDNVPGDFCQDYDCSQGLLPSHRQSCERITGTVPAGKWPLPKMWGQGVIRFLETNDNIERWSWWTTYNNGTAPEVPAERQLAASLLTKDDKGDLIPAENGRALQLGTFADDCTFANCSLSCAEFKAPWSTKCGWKTNLCSGCPQC